MVALCQMIGVSANSVVVRAKRSVASAMDVAAYNKIVEHVAGGDADPRRVSAPQPFRSQKRRAE